MDQAMTVGAPVIGLNDSGGARIQVRKVHLKSSTNMSEMKTFFIDINHEKMCRES